MDLRACLVSAQFRFLIANARSAPAVQLARAARTAEAKDSGENGFSK